MRILQNPDYTKNQSQEYKEGFENGVKASQKHIFQEFETILIKGIKNLSWSTNFLNSIACRYKILMIKQKFSEEKIKSYLEDYFEKTRSFYYGTLACRIRLRMPVQARGRGQWREDITADA